MSNKIKIDLEAFTQDLYDLLGRNGITQRQFFDKYVATDDAFMVDHFEDEGVIYFDDVTITIKRN